MDVWLKISVPSEYTTMKVLCSHNGKVLMLRDSDMVLICDMKNCLTSTLDADFAFERFVVGFIETMESPHGRLRFEEITEVEDNCHGRKAEGKDQMPMELAKGEAPRVRKWKVKLKLKLKVSFILLMQRGKRQRKKKSGGAFIKAKKV